MFVVYAQPSLPMAMVSPRLSTAGTYGGFGKIVTVDYTWEDMLSQSTLVSSPSPPMATACVSLSQLHAWSLCGFCMECTGTSGVSTVLVPMPTQY